MLSLKAFDFGDCAPLRVAVSGFAHENRGDLFLPALQPELCQKFVRYGLMLNHSRLFGVTDGSLIEIERRELSARRAFYFRRQQQRLAEKVFGAVFRQDREPRLPFYRMMFMDLTLRLVIVYSMPESAKLEAARDIHSALERDSLTHRIAEYLPLGDIVRASEIVEQGAVRGCVVLKID